MMEKGRQRLRVLAFGFQQDRLNSWLCLVLFLEWGFLVTKW